MQYSTVDFPFIGQLREDTEPKLLSDGFTQISNGRFTKTGKIEKRLGMVQGANVQMGYIERLVNDNGRLIGIGDDSTVTNAMCAVANGTRWERMDRIAEATIRREGVARDISESILECNVGYSNGWLFYIWKRNDTGGTFDIWLRIVNATTGAITSETAITTGNRSGVKAIASTSGNVMLVTWFESGGTIRGYSYDTSTNPPTAIASNVAIVTDAKSSIYDIVPATGTTWWLAYIDTADDVRGKLISSSALGTTTNFTIAGTMTLPAIAFGTDLTLCYWDGTNVKYDIWTTAGAHSSGPFNLDNVQPLNQPAIVDAFSGSNRLFAWTTLTGNLHKWRTGSIGGVLGTTHVNYRFNGQSKIFKDTSPAGNSRYFQWVRSNDALTQNRDTLSLVELNDDTGSLLRPVAVAAFGFVGISTSPNLVLVAIESTHNFRVGLLVAILPGVSVTGFDEIKIRFDHPNRWPYETFGLSTYVGSGCLQQIAGKWVDETGFLQVPKVTATDHAGTGIAAGDYQYCVVYEYVAENGTRTYSLPSGVSSVTVTDHGGGEGNASLAIEPLTLTNRQRGNRSKPKVLIAIYRTEQGPGEVFFRLHTIDAHPDALENDPAATTAITFVDNIPDSGIISHERLYTTGGVLENDTVYGGCTFLARHKNRLFACGGESKSTIWYSQEFVSGRPAEWNIALQIEIPGEDVVAIASLDDALIAFTTTKVFAIYGDGPNATGDPNSGFFSIAQLVTSDVGCSYTRSIVQTSRGIYFSYRGALYLIDRGRQIHLVSTPVQESAWTYRVVIGSAYSPDNGEVKFSCTNSAGDTGITLVYNETLDRWTTSLYFASAPLKDIIWHSDNRLHVAYNGDEWHDDETSPSYLDNGSEYVLSVQTGHISFGSLQSLKRCRRVRVMYTNEGGLSGLTLVIKSFETADRTEVHSWSASEIAAITNDSVRAHMQNQKGHKYQFTVLENPNTASGPGLSFQGLSFEVGSTPNLQRASAAASK